MTRGFARVRAMWSALRRGAQLDAAMHEEMRFHVDMEAERLVREQGLDAAEARRRALVAFGGVEKYKEKGRDVRGVQWLDATRLDARLAVRMLLKHRGLTFVGGFAMAVAIAVGATAFEMMTQVLNPALPLEEGDRVVALQNVSQATGGAERRVLHDFVSWREELRSIEQLSAFRTVQHNLVSGNALPEPVRVAEITASGFTVARTPPHTGRYLVPGDERDDAPRVLVVGYQAWQTRFGGDVQLVGRAIMLGGAPHIVVGIMPDGFRFPVDHQFWTPLRARRTAFERLKGPQLHLFGRLAAGVTLEAAQTELDTVGRRAASAFPATHERLRPLVMPYTREHLDLSLEDPGIVLLFRIARLFVGALTFVVAVNLAILVYARTVTRLGEIAVRTALGASRRRILAQLFIEALALSVVGAAAGLALVQVALVRMQPLARANGAVPFWIDFNLSTGTVVYAFGLAVLAAAIMGVLPGLKATGRRVTENLRDLGGMSARLGPMWTTLVVAQVAVAVAVLPLSVYFAVLVAQLELAGPGFAAERFVIGQVTLGGERDSADADRLRRGQLEFMAQLKNEPGVSAVTFSSYVPGFGGGRRIELEDGGVARESDVASVFEVDVDLLGVYPARVLAGRALNAGDLGAARAVVVNRSFVEQFLKGRSALGARFRYAGPEPNQPWSQIVGVVDDFPSFPSVLHLDTRAAVYQPAAPGDLNAIVYSVRFNGGIPTGFTDRFRVIGAEVDPALQVRRALPLAEFYGNLRSFWRYFAWGAGLVTACVLLLSAAGIYALMSFTVAQRTREIGIRTALGAQPRRIVFSIFSRAARQLTLGVVVGSVLSGAAFSMAGLGLAPAVGLLVGVATIMLIVGLLAAVGPARRSLRIHASDALRADT